MNAAPKLALGLMSGTSMDGVDAALLETDGEGFIRPGQALTVSYSPALRSRLRDAVNSRDPTLWAVIEPEVTRVHAAAANALISALGMDASGLSVIGCHGHTMLHEPDAGRTVQIIDGQSLANALGVPVVTEFRRADVAAGGQGAPLIPVYHQAIAATIERPVAIVNIGGVANVTYIDQDLGLLAFDTGPGGALIDDWVSRHTDQHFDAGGSIALQGCPDLAVVQAMGRHPYFAKKPPKSLDRDDFNLDLLSGKSLADGAATLTAFSAECIARAARFFPKPVKRWLVTGGGRHNQALLDRMRRLLTVPVKPIESIGHNGDGLEAHGFAYLAVRHLRTLPISFPTTTGAPRPLCGGTIFQPAVAHRATSGMATG